MTGEPDLERLFRLRLVVARLGEMDNAGWWNTNGLLGGRGAFVFRRGFPTTHAFAQARAVFGGQADALLLPRTTRTHLDLWQANRLQLEAVGVGQVEVAGICTRCHTHDYFSHRGEGGRTGRFGAVIGYRA